MVISDRNLHFEGGALGFPGPAPRAAAPRAPGPPRLGRAAAGQLTSWVLQAWAACQAEMGLRPREVRTSSEGSPPSSPTRREQPNQILVRHERRVGARFEERTVVGHSLPPGYLGQPFADNLPPRVFRQGPPPPARLPKGVVEQRQIG